MSTSSSTTTSKEPGDANSMQTVTSAIGDVSQDAMSQRLRDIMKRARALETKKEELSKTTVIVQQKLEETKKMLAEMQHATQDMLKRRDETKAATDQVLRDIEQTKMEEKAFMEQLTKTLRLVDIVKLVQSAESSIVNEEHMTKNEHDAPKTVAPQPTPVVQQPTTVAQKPIVAPKTDAAPKTETTAVPKPKIVETKSTHPKPSVKTDIVTNLLENNSDDSSVEEVDYTETGKKRKATTTTTTAAPSKKKKEEEEEEEPESEGENEEEENEEGEENEDEEEEEEEDETMQSPSKKKIVIPGLKTDVTYTDMKHGKHTVKNGEVMGTLTHKEMQDMQYNSERCNAFARKKRGGQRGLKFVFTQRSEIPKKNAEYVVPYDIAIEVEDKNRVSACAYCGLPFKKGMYAVRSCKSHMCHFKCYAFVSSVMFEDKNEEGEENEHVCPGLFGSWSNCKR